MFLPLLIPVVLAAACAGRENIEPDLPLDLPEGDDTGVDSDVAVDTDVVDSDEPLTCPNNYEPLLQNPLDLPDTDVETEPCLCFGMEESFSAPSSEATQHLGAAVLDYDGNGSLDIFIKNYNAPNEMFQNNGNGFSKISGQWGESSFDSVWQDFDADGAKELLIAGEEGVRVFENSQGVLQDEGSLLYQGAAIAVGVVSEGVLIGSSDGLGTRFIPLEGTDNPIEAAYAAGLNDPGQASRIKVDRFDSDNDGAQEEHVFIANQTGINRHFIKRPRSSVYESLDVGTTPAGNRPAMDAEWLRFEGAPALYIGNTAYDTPAPNEFYVMNADGTFTDIAEELGLNDPGATMAVAVTDNPADTNHPIFAFGHAPQVMGGQPQAAETTFMVPWPSPQFPRGYSYRNIASYPQLAGLNRSGQIQSVAFADFNGDGFNDLYSVPWEGSISLHSQVFSPYWVNPCTVNEE